MDELNLMNLLLFLAFQNSSGGSGGGGTSVYIPNCSIDENGDLIVTLSDGTVMNAGKCKGDDGESPTINVYDASPGNYQLEIVNPDGTSYITPNLMGSGTSSTRYTVYKNSLYTSYLDSVYTIFNSELKSIQDYIDGGNSFCNESESYSLYYNTTLVG